MYYSIAIMAETKIRNWSSKYAATIVAFLTLYPKFCKDINSFKKPYKQSICYSSLQWKGLHSVQKTEYCNYIEVRSHFFWMN